MKKNLPYIIASLVILGIVILFVTGAGSSSHKKMDQRITLRKSDRIPYGTFVAYSNLHYLFPKATIFTDRSVPGYWDSLSNYDEGQACIIITSHFNADEEELKKLIRFVENGNDVFVSANTVSYDVEKMLRCETNGFNNAAMERMTPVNHDSLTVALNCPPFDTAFDKGYTYPGANFSHHFTRIDESVTSVLGYSKENKPNFISFRAGAGHFFVQLAPMAFTNYFLLHKNNFSYYENCFSVINPATTKIVWDEYYLYQKQDNEPPVKKRGLLGVLFRYPALRWALLTAMFTLLIYTLLEMRRKQRLIPVVKRPQNDSLDFVRTVGRLYFDKGDHFNLVRKMSAYFLEYVRAKYKLSTGTLDDAFVKNLAYKSGTPETDVRGIIDFILHLNQPVKITADQVSAFHKQLESFYKTA